MLGDDVIPYVGRGREENSHAGVFGDGDDLGDGFGEGEWGVGFFKKWGEELFYVSQAPCLMSIVYVIFTDLASHNLSINNLFTNCLAKGCLA